MAGGGILQNRQLHGLEPHFGRLGKPDQKALDGIESDTLGGADHGHRGAQFAGQGQGIDLATARRHQVRHIQQHQRRQTHGQHRSGQHQLAIQLQSIQHQQHCVRSRSAGHVALQYIDRDSGVLRIRIKAIDPGQVDQGQLAMPDPAHAGGVMLHRDPGIVGHFLAHAGQAIEKSRLTGIRRPNERDRADFSRDSGLGGLDGNAAAGAAMAHRASFRTATKTLWTEINLAVSLRSATSAPSTQ